MSIVRSIEVIAQSPNSFDDACREAIKEAAKTLRGINSFWIKNAECVVENDQITMYRVNGTRAHGLGVAARLSRARISVASGQFRDYCARHSAEHALNHVQKLCTRRQRR
jgi:flavin-binding protein dodecin